MSLGSLLTNPTTEIIIEVYIGNMIFSAIVQSLPSPDKVGNNVFYTTIFNFLSIIAADFKSFQKAFPQPQNFVLTQGTTSTGKPLIQEGIPVKPKDPLNE